MFILCTKGLLRIIAAKVLAGRIHGCKLIPIAPPILHLFFVDDNIFFFDVKLEEANILKAIRDKYAEASAKLLISQNHSFVFV